MVQRTEIGEATEHRVVRALFTETTVTVYQAYPPEIAAPAVRAGTFVPPFRRERMTWIKPSFLWMMYRSGWATKPGQERVLAVEITRDGFEWALRHSCLSSFEAGTYASRAAWEERRRLSPVRVQWDPERSLSLAPLNHRAIQVGLSGEAVHRFLGEWIVRLTDVTPSVRSVAEAVDAGELQAAEAQLPREAPYPLSDDLAMLTAATAWTR